MMRRAVLAGLALLGGCKLIDQRTFDPEAGRAPPVPPPPPAPPAPVVAPTGPLPLVTIPLAPPVDYDVPLRQGIAAALARGRRDFDVRTSVPATGTPDTEATATEAAAPVAARVARLIAAQGGRAILSAQVAPGAASVLVFVR